MTTAWRIAACVLMFATVTPAGGADQPVHWPQWRGPNLDGSSTATGLPVDWSESKNIVWKVPMPSWSGATAIIWGDRIFVTSPSRPSKDDPNVAEGRGRSKRDPGGYYLMLMCLNKRDGSVRWQRKLGGGNQFLMKQNMASPSPVTDGEHVWVMTGTGVLACFDFDGKERWRRDIQSEYGKFGLNWGFASSPLLLENQLVIQVLHGMKTDEPSYLFAVDKQTGKTMWKVDRPTDAPMEAPDAYTTPTILRRDGWAQIIVSGGDYLTGHSVKTGREVWRLAGLNPQKNEYYRTIASPMVAGGMVFACSRKDPLMAVRPGTGGADAKATTAWKTRLGPDVPTPVCDGKNLYILRDNGVMLCFDAKTGDEVYGETRVGRGTYSASPLLADGKIYITNETGTTTVVAAGPEPKPLATNQLADKWVLASFAVSEGRLFLRASESLYCIGSQ